MFILYKKRPKNNLMGIPLLKHVKANGENDLDIFLSRFSYKRCVWHETVCVCVWYDGTYDELWEISTYHYLFPSFYSGLPVHHNTEYAEME